MKYKKCKHDKCMRKAESNGYCNKCHQLNSKECEFCSNSSIAKYNKKNKTQKSKHNRWIDGLIRGEKYFHSIQVLAKCLFFVLVFLSCDYFWSTYYLGFPNEVAQFGQLALLMLLLFRLVMFLFLGSVLFRYLCYYLSNYLIVREEEKLLKEGRKEICQ